MPGHLTSLGLDFLTFNKMGLLGDSWLGGQIESISAKHLKQSVNKVSIIIIFSLLSPPGLSHLPHTRYLNVGFDGNKEAIDLFDVYCSHIYQNLVKK